MSGWVQVVLGLALAYGAWRMFRLLRPGVGPADAARAAAAGTAVVVEIGRASCRERV